MYLLKSEIEKDETITQVEFEKVAEDLLMISVNYDVNDKSKVFSYWRLLGTGANPPMEIGINTDKKTIKNITLFVDADCFKGENFQETNMIRGNIIVDAHIFKKENDYVDTTGKYFISVSDNKLMCTFDSNSCIKKIIGNNHVGFLVNYNDEICGFTIYNLDEHQIKKIDSIK